MREYSGVAISNRDGLGAGVILDWIGGCWASSSTSESSDGEEYSGGDEDELFFFDLGSLGIRSKFWFSNFLNNSKSS